MNAWKKHYGKTITSVEGCVPGSDEIVICGADWFIRLYHQQDCCESVSVEDVEGDPNDLVGAILTRFEETEAGESVHAGLWSEPGRLRESETWTFYKVETSKGGLWIRWYGSSNGYYSESVDAEVSE